MPPNLQPLADAPAASVRPGPWFRRYPIAVFLVALVLSIVSAPLEEQFPEGDFIEVARFTLVLLMALLAMAGRGRTLSWGLVLVAPALLGKWVHHVRPELLPASVFLTPGLLFVGFVVWQLLRFIVRTPRVNSEVLCAGVAGYLMLGLLWSLAYTLAGSVLPEAFAFNTGSAGAHAMKGFTAIYFSFATLCTVGYGDIVPVAGIARMLAVTEAMAGTLYLTVLIARLVALYSTPPPTSEAAASEAR